MMSLCISSSQLCLLVVLVSYWSSLRVGTCCTVCPREQQLVVCVWVSLCLLQPKDLCAADLDNNDKFWEWIRTGARREKPLGVFLERLKHLVQPDGKGALKPLAAIRVIG